MSNITKVCVAIEQDVLNTLGLAVDTSCLTIAQLKSDYHTFGKFTIAPAMCGPVGAMFKSITCKVMAGVVQPVATSPISVVMVYEYDYNHPCGGHNGYTLRKDVKIN